MSVAEQVLQGVRIRPESEEMVRSANVDPVTGFMRLPLECPARVGQTAFLGFGVSGWQHGTAAVAERFRPWTSVTCLDPAMVTINRQGKGVGARMYNTPQAIDGSAEKPDRVGMYRFSVDSIRDYTGRRAWLAAEQVLLTVASLMVGPERVITVNNRRYSDADALLYDQTIDGRRRRRQGGDRPSDVPERLMVVRNRTVMFDLVGVYEKAAVS